MAKDKRTAFGLVVMAIIPAVLSLVLALLYPQAISSTILNIRLIPWLFDSYPPSLRPAVKLPLLGSCWTDSEARQEIKTYANRSFNHRYTGSISLRDDIDETNSPAGFLFLHESVNIGNGIDDYNKAVKLMENFEMVNRLPWIKIILDDNKLTIGNNLATLANSYGLLWSLNPCRIVSYVRDKKASKSYPLANNKSKRFTATFNSTIYTEIGYSTLQGHLIAGEERFRVSFVSNGLGQSDGAVIFEVCSYSKGSGLLGSSVLPLIRPLQSRFFCDVPKSMATLMSR